MYQRSKKTNYTVSKKKRKQNFPANSDTSSSKILMQTAGQDENNCRENEQEARKSWEHLTQREMISESRCNINT
uniref:Uncharacterized protein n=1 Tax=Ixodes ricinus TaxID=34613 RepID=A0A131XSJ5_IXORI